MIHDLRKRASGFTIIEVMIVLAIAGLIMLIVFLAVPALQRNAHNTSIKNDVSSILGAINEYENNNNGSLPTVASVSGGTLTIGSNCATTGSNCATSHLGYITVVNNPTSTISTTAPAVGTVNLYSSATCNGNTPTVGTSTRSIVAYYQLEGGAVQCSEV
jgi:prepilin-type N-terminal cleavage/methylation domain-containing protein